MLNCYERNKQIDTFHPFHPFQITPLETEYPTQDDIDIGGPEHEAFAWMSPFKALYNIHGLSTHCGSPQRVIGADTLSFNAKVDLVNF